MFVREINGQIVVVTSASDLTAASACEFAFLRRFDAKLGRDVVVPADDDPMLARAARLGDAHEARVLAALNARLGRGVAGKPGGVVEIPRPASMEFAALSDVAEQTIIALRGGAGVVFQATFFEQDQRPADPVLDDPAIAFLGFADFLERRADGSYEVQDTKLARRAKVSALMQLTAYAEQLDRLGIPVAAETTLILGDGARSAHRLSDIAPVFRARRERLHRLMLERFRVRGADGSHASAAAIAWGADHSENSLDVRACGRCEVCAPEVERARDPLLIAGMRATQRDALLGAGLRTIDDVAQALPAVIVGGLTVEGIQSAVLERLALQAALQVERGESAVPPIRVVDPSAFAALPAPDSGDLFFDFEGDPLYREPGAGDSARWGLDYLFGMVDTRETFTALWAHDLDAEREALLKFLALVAERRRVHPKMHIYHYAAYERTHLLSIASRHGVGEAGVDQLLREHVLVDLYPIVRRALRVGSHSYSIKKLEPLYMGDELRDESGVTSAAQSVNEYADATELMRSALISDREEGQSRLDAIGDYNRYDCVSTLRLRDWLIELATAAGYVGENRAGLVVDTSASSVEPALALSPLAARLAEHASHAAEPTDRKAAALAGSAIDYYEREQKSFWWAHFARLVDPIEDWSDTRDVMVVERGLSAVVDDWRAPEGRQRTHRRELRLRGEIAPGSSLKAGSDVFLVYEYPAPFGAPANAAPGARGARQKKISERFEDGVQIIETRSDDTEPYDELPIALTPGPPPPPGAQKGAIEEWGRHLADSLDRGGFLADPVVDIMRRVRPRRLGQNELVDPASAEADLAYPAVDGISTIGAVVASLRTLDRSALAVQGPPGTGKTYLAARVIKTLVEQNGWHIGVVAQSHRVVENVLEGVVKAGLDPECVGKVPQGGKLPEDAPPPPYTVLRSGGQPRFVEQLRASGHGSVTGGTAWDFSNATRFDRKSLDLLVIDEAGQFSLAPTIAASVAAERLLLLGDPQQLPQVSQGSHPEPVDESALGWLLGQHETIPEGTGYFLSETRRMRPELADVVSELSYEGRLHAHPSAAQREVRGAGPAGLVWQPVEHAGNATHSVEEAAEVVRIARETLQGVIYEPGEAPRQMTQADLIVVAAYNAQVECVAEALAAAGLGEVRVGTVDKFQGQEAAIAIVTLAASSADDVPRGLEFLLMRNRLNVAISRAQWAAHLVSSTRLGEGLPATAEGVAALAGYLRLTERGSHMAIEDTVSLGTVEA